MSVLRLYCNFSMFKLGQVPIFVEKGYLTLKSYDCIYMLLYVNKQWKMASFAEVGSR